MRAKKHRSLVGSKMEHQGLKAKKTQAGNGVTQPPAAKSGASEKVPELLGNSGTSAFHSDFSQKGWMVTPKTIWAVCR